MAATPYCAKRRQASSVACRTTSGGRGFRTGLSLTLGYVAAAPGTTRAELLEGSHEVGVAGERFRLSALARAPYDPDGLRMRG